MALLLISGLAAGGWWLWRSQPAAETVPLATVRVGTLTASLEADALLVRRERVHVAPYGGQVERLAADGERVRVGSQVVGITEGVAVPSTSAEKPATPPDTTPTQTGPKPPGAPTLALPAQASPAKLEYERLAAEIYAAAIQLSEARYLGEATGAYQDQLDHLAQRQAQLLPALRGEEEAAMPVTDEEPASPPTDPEPPDPAPPTADTRTLGTDQAGVVLYQVDGLESKLTPEAVAGWSPSDLLGLPYPDARTVAEGSVAEGDPLFKLVDDLSLEMLILTPASSLSNAQRSAIADAGVTLRVPSRERTLQAEVIRVAEEGEHLLLHLAMPLPSQEALRLRRMRVELLLDQYSGTILPRSAVDVQQGRTGVWVAEGSRFRFEPARVLGGNQQEVAVESQLAPDAQVLPNPPPPDDRIILP